METLLSSQTWDVKESAILVLGVISDPDGALSAIEPHLSNLIPFLRQELQSNNEIVRSTSCWALSKFSVWIC